MRSKSSPASKTAAHGPANRPDDHELSGGLTIAGGVSADAATRLLKALNSENLSAGILLLHAERTRLLVATSRLGTARLLYRLMPDSVEVDWVVLEKAASAADAKGGFGQGVVNKKLVGKGVQEGKRREKRKVGGVGGEGRKRFKRSKRVDKGNLLREIQDTEEELAEELEEEGDEKGDNEGGEQGGKEGDREGDDEQGYSEQMNAQGQAD